MVGGGRIDLCIDLRLVSKEVSHRHGLTCNLLKLLPVKRMTRMIMEFVQNSSFTRTTGSGNQSRLPRLRNGVPQESVLAPLLYNVYTYDLPFLLRQKYVYVDDLALLHTLNNWKSWKGV